MSKKKQKVSIPFKSMMKKNTNKLLAVFVYISPKSVDVKTVAGWYAVI
jgi:hypothetical protein